MLANRRPIREMPMRRRHLGLSPLDLQNMQDYLVMAFRIIQYAVTLPAGILRTFLFFIVTLLCASVTQMAQYVYQNLDTVDPRNKNRDINSFSEDECWAFFRFRKEQMHELCHKLGVPAFIICRNRCIVLYSV
jgi:hypothetical protein